MSWTQLGDWWREEIAGDPAYDEVTTPLLLHVLDPLPGSSYLDIGCGEGRVMRAVADTGALVRGVDINPELVAGLARAVVADAADLPFPDDEFDGCYALLVLEHVEDHRAVYAEAARVTRPGGVLAQVSNHPYWTSIGATPIEDDDGEELWRPGEYFGSGHTDIPIRGDTVRFHHRSMGEILNSVAAAGWSLEAMTELPHHDLTSAAEVPRLLACRWRLLP